MGDIGEQRAVIEDFSKAVDQSAFVLKENPELTFPQIYNRIQGTLKHNNLMKTILKNGQKEFVRPWIRLLNNLPESYYYIRTFVLVGYRGEIGSCMFSPDGKNVIAAKPFLIIWDVKTGQEIGILKSLSKTAQISPDGKRLLVKYFKENNLWDLQSQKEIASFEAVYSNFSPNGKRIVSWNKDLPYIELRDSHSGATINIIDHKGEIKFCIFSNNSKIIAACGKDGFIHLLDG